MSNQLGSYLAVIKVVGIGGGGTNAVTRMVEAGLSGVEFVAVNTDAQALLMTEADEKIHIGSTRDARPRRRRRSPRRARRRRGESRRAEGGAQGRGHGVRHGRRGRRHGYRRCSGRRADRTRARRAHGGRRHEAVRIRGQASGRPGRAGHPVTARERRHAHRHRERPAASGRRALDARDRGVPYGRRHPAPGRAGHHRPHHGPGLINLDFADVRTIMREAGSALMGIGTRAATTARSRRRGPRSRRRSSRRRSTAPPASSSTSPAARPRARRGGRGCAGRHERGGLERERDLRRRHRRGAWARTCG